MLNSAFEKASELFWDGLFLGDEPPKIQTLSARDYERLSLTSSKFWYVHVPQFQFF